MLGPAVNLLLICTLLVCPHLCGAGPTCSASESTATTACSCCCKHLQHSSHNSNDAPGRNPQNDTGAGLQCICAGAVKSELTQFNCTPQIADFCAVPGVAFGLLIESNISRRAIEAFPDVGWILSGRDRCCLHSSLLC